MFSLREIEYRPYQDGEREAVEAALAVGNRVIHSLASRPGMRNEPDARNAYRRAVLTPLGKHPDLSVAELTVCRSLPPAEVEAVRRVEGLKWRIIQAHVRKVWRVVQSKVGYARFYRNDDAASNLLEDLESEAMTCLVHALYSFLRPDGKFLHYLTIALHNHLHTYCQQRYPLVPVSDSLNADVARFYQVRAALRRKGAAGTFDEVVADMVAEDLRAEGQRVCPGRVEAAVRDRREWTVRLRQALRRTVSVGEGLTAPAAEPDWSADLVEAVAARLDPIDRQTLYARLDGRPLNEVAGEMNMTPKQVYKRMERVKAEIGRYITSKRFVAEAA
jgi:DNA-directed RNA polymerase specialized sigma24 family protein